MMEAWLVALIIVVVAGFVLFGTNFGKDPTKKTLPQLEREIGLHHKRLKAISASSGFASPRYMKAAEEMMHVEQEIAKRKSAAEVQSVANALFSTMTADRLRALVEGAYDEMWQRAKDQDKANKVAHEASLINALAARLRLEAPDMEFPLAEPSMRALQMEVLPFNVIPFPDGKRAMIEYICWRDFPSEANDTIVREALRAATDIFVRNDGGLEFIEGLRRWPCPWTVLLPSTLS